MGLCPRGNSERTSDAFADDRRSQCRVTRKFAPPPRPDESKTSQVTREDARFCLTLLLNLKAIRHNQIITLQCYSSSEFDQKQVEMHANLQNDTEIAKTFDIMEKIGGKFDFSDVTTLKRRVLWVLGWRSINHASMSRENRDMTLTL